MDKHYRYSTVPIVIVRAHRYTSFDPHTHAQTAKGWTSSPFNDLVVRGCVKGNPETGWTLTTIGEDVADKCLQAWDEHQEEVVVALLYILRLVVFEQ